MNAPDEDIMAETPLRENMVVPPVLKGFTGIMDKLAERPLLSPGMEFPAGQFMQCGGLFWDNSVLMLISSIHIRPERCLWDAETSGYSPSRVQGQVSREHYGSV
jgi:hypothetical protein